MKAKAKVLLLSTILLSMIPLFALVQVSAVPVPWPTIPPYGEPTKPPGYQVPDPSGPFKPLIVWQNSTSILPPYLYRCPPTRTPQFWYGIDVWRDLAIDPEWLQVRADTTVSHDTWIHVTGADTYGEPVEGWAFFPAGFGSEEFKPLIDVHSGQNVTFATITGIYQQGGEHCNAFEISTMPEPHEEYLGRYFKTDSPPYHSTLEQPSNPDPLKVLVNWIDDGDNIPESDVTGGDQYQGAKDNGTIYIKGLDEDGNVLVVDVDVPVGTGTWDDPILISDAHCGNHTWTDVCSVWGGNDKDSYYIFTHPKDQRYILEYHIRIHHITVEVWPKDILANGTDTANITITFKDVDDRPVHWSTHERAMPVTINVYASGGTVTPSWIQVSGCHTNTTVELESDTNARSVHVTACAILPEIYIPPPTDNLLHPEYELWGEDYITFDGVNSRMVSSKIMDIGGPRFGTGKYYEVYIPLIEGCNLISIPVWTDPVAYPGGLTPSMLRQTSANMCLVSICWYDAQAKAWHTYDFPTGGFTGNGNAALIPGRGYWIKAEKNCTLVISGHFYDQYDFVPPEHPIYFSWNLIGVTSLVPVTVSNYLGPAFPTANGGRLLGPLWRWNAETQQWFRIDFSDFDTVLLQPTWGLWLNSYGTQATWIAP